MKLDPLPAKKKQVEELVNKHFPWSFGYRDMAHMHKRNLALEVMRGKQPTEDFVQAAQVENMTPEDLAALIVTKPDLAMQKENERRKRIIRTRNAKSLDELRSILDEIGWTGEF